MGGIFEGQFDQKRLLSSLSPVPMSPVAAGDKSFFSPRDTLKALAGRNEAETPRSAPGYATKSSSVNNTATSSPTSVVASGGSSALLADEDAKKQASTALLGK